MRTEYRLTIGTMEPDAPPSHESQHTDISDAYRYLKTIATEQVPDYLIMAALQDKTVYFEIREKATGDQTGYASIERVDFPDEGE
jgi:hypothetical protein